MTCSKCRREYVNGTQWCYNHCWVPLTWLGVHQRFMCIVDKRQRDEELLGVYGLTPKMLQAKHNELGSTINSLPLTRSLKQL